MCGNALIKVSFNFIRGLHYATKAVYVGVSECNLVRKKDKDWPTRVLLYVTSRVFHKNDFSKPNIVHIIAFF